MWCPAAGRWSAASPIDRLVAPSWPAETSTAVPRRHATRSPLMVVAPTRNVIVPNDSPDRSGSKPTSTVQDSATAWSVQSSSIDREAVANDVDLLHDGRSAAHVGERDHRRRRAADGDLRKLELRRMDLEAWWLARGVGVVGVVGVVEVAGGSGCGSGAAPAAPAAAKSARHPPATAAVGRRPARSGGPPRPVDIVATFADTRLWRPPRRLALGSLDCQHAR